VEPSRSLPQPAGRGLPDVNKPSLPMTVLLVVVSTALWMAVLQACFPLAVQSATCEKLEVALPFPAVAVLTLSFWHWFALYWWMVAAVFLPASGVFAFVTILLRHGIRSRLIHWTWGMFLIVTPFFVLEVLLLTIWQSTVMISRATILKG
jgi:hypothetical protein